MISYLSDQSNEISIAYVSPSEVHTLGNDYTDTIHSLIHKRTYMLHTTTKACHVKSLPAISIILPPILTH